ncbi:MAG TPA: sugar phosphate nucleotidyltransferase [Anaerolineales bacterium]|nr:sugar phosphate nucleotidyltransferase [Anaerolineales bacterium]
MRIVIPMAGYGARLRPHTWSKPKPLVTVAGKPVLGHVLDIFSTLPRIDEVVFIVGYLGEQVAEYVGHSYPHLKAVYVEQTELKGQSHALWLARQDLRGPILICFVDTLIEADLSGLAETSAEAVAWVTQVPDPRRFGVAQVGADGWVQRLVEKPQDMSNNLVVVGFYYFQQAESLISAIEEQMARDTQLKGEYYLVDAINILLERGLKMCVQPVEVWQDCGKPETLLATNRYLLEHGRDNSSQAAGRDGVVIVPPVYVDPSAEVKSSIIGPWVTIGADCHVERSVIQDSIVDSGSHILESSLSGSLIGREARVVGRPRTLNVGDSSEVGFA